MKLLAKAETRRNFRSHRTIDKLKELMFLQKNKNIQKISLFKRRLEKSTYSSTEPRFRNEQCNF